MARVNAKSSVIKFGVPSTGSGLRGIEMGVLRDGTAFFTARGLAEFCGVAPSVIMTWKEEWSWTSTRPRDRTIAEILSRSQYSGDLYTCERHRGQEVHAFPDIVCLAVLEYYAFHANHENREFAQKRLASMTQRSLRDFVYASVGYVPPPSRPLQVFEDRLLLNNEPQGFFSVFMQSAKLQLMAIRAGLPLDSHTVPDISIGQCWGREWDARGYEGTYGSRVRHPHRYPAYFPQDAVDITPWVYPKKALGDFHLWLEGPYLQDKLPKYLSDKIKDGQLTSAAAAGILSAVVLPQLAVDLPAAALSRQSPTRSRALKQGRP